MSIELAIKEALKNPIRPRGRNSISRFACILTNGRDTFIGLNSYKSHPLQFKFSKDSQKVCIHSEIAALAKASKEYTDLSKFKMYVARVLADGTPALARPCCICEGAIREFGITQVYWTE